MIDVTFTNLLLFYSLLYYYPTLYNKFPLQKIYLKEFCDMLDLLYFLAQQVPAPITEAPNVGANSASSSGNITLLMMAGAFLLMYFLIIYPQRKEEKRKKAMLSSLQKGDAVIMNSGIKGTVSSIKEDSVFINVGDGTRIEFLRSAISSLQTKTSSK